MTTVREVAKSLLTGIAVGLLIIGVAALVSGCPAPPAPDPKPPRPTSPAATCVRACDHLAAIGCHPDGCDEICTRVGDQRFTDCLGAAASCAAADRCDTAH